MADASAFLEQCDSDARTGAMNKEQQNFEQEKTEKTEKTERTEIEMTLLTLLPPIQTGSLS